MIDPVALHRGSDAAIDFLQDGVIHTASGRTIPVRVPGAHGRQELLGRTQGGWAVASWLRTTAVVDVVRRGRAPQRVRRSRTSYFVDGTESLGFRLSRDGAWLLRTVYDRGGSTTRVTDVATGRWLGTGFGDYYTPFDADAGHVVTLSPRGGRGTGVVDWVPGTPIVARIATRAAAADIGRDLLWVGTTTPDFGPTSLSSPGVPAWSAPIAPIDVSPDGATVVGLRTGRAFQLGPAVLDVRAMADGRLLDSIALDEPYSADHGAVTRTHDQTVRFESDDAVVLQLASPRGKVLVRCRVAGACERASDHGGDVSVPHEQYMR
jgi:hypothetical protein